MALPSLVGKLRIPAFPQRAAGFRRVAFQDKMSSRAFSKTICPTGARVESYDQMFQSCIERVEKEARRQRRSMWKAVLGAQATVLAICFGGLCYWADNNRVEKLPIDQQD